MVILPHRKSARRGRRRLAAQLPAATCCFETSPRRARWGAVLRPRGPRTLHRPWLEVARSAPACIAGLVERPSRGAPMQGVHKSSMGLPMAEPSGMFRPSPARGCSRGAGGHPILPTLLPRTWQTCVRKPHSATNALHDVSCATAKPVSPCNSCVHQFCVPDARANPGKNPPCITNYFVCTCPGTAHNAR